MSSEYEPTPQTLTWVKRIGWVFVSAACAAGWAYDVWGRDPGTELRIDLEIPGVLITPDTSVTLPTPEFIDNEA